EATYPIRFPVDTDLGLVARHAGRHLLAVAEYTRHWLWGLGLRGWHTGLWLCGLTSHRLRQGLGMGRRLLARMLRLARWPRRRTALPRPAGSRLAPPVRARSRVAA